MKVEIFEMERAQSLWENRVRYNLSESGVHPLTAGELDVDLGEVLLGYPQTNGSPPLREAVSSLYPDATAEHVVVTNGTAEANFIAVWNLVEAGDEVVVMTPNYMQIWGYARSLGATVKAWPLRRDDGRWAPDLSALEELVTPRTRLITLCNPNNPTGGALTGAELDAVAAVAERAGAWVLSDEVYRGAELNGPETESFWGRSPRALVACGLSKAYGLPGLRIGWLAGPPDRIAELWSHKDYTSIGPGALSDRLARAALEPSRRERILARTRQILREQLPIVATWIGRHESRLRFLPPVAGAIAYVEYDFPIESQDFFERLRDEKSVLVVPGSHFGMGRFLRIGFGGDPADLERGLSLVSELVSTVLDPTDTSKDWRIDN